MALILYFGRLTDVSGKDSEVLQLPENIATCHDLKRWLDQRFDVQNVFDDTAVRVAVNGEILSDAASLSGPEEIALMPPVGGG